MFEDRRLCHSDCICPVRCNAKEARCMDKFCSWNAAHPLQLFIAEARRKNSGGSVFYLEEEIAELASAPLTSIIREKRLWEWKMSKIAARRDPLRLERAEAHHEKLKKKEVQAVDEALLEAYPCFEDALPGNRTCFYRERRFLFLQPFQPRRVPS
uniref:Pescadillo domain-containing protein n=1 Tax=Metchnikovella dogieli TaxID=2804710 RepID=A0A896WNI8_9MICR|nr:Pescadillo domain-containing protein [Metchnikovella dogieli]